MSKKYCYTASEIRLDALEVIKGCDEKALLRRRLHLKESSTVEITRRSLDSRFHESRGIFYVYSVLITSPVPIKNKLLKPSEPPKALPPTPSAGSSPRVVIAGSGPAGLFCALQLCEAGIRPVILERGRDIPERQRDVEEFAGTGTLSEISNVQFGLGGAGTFSDGKLNTRIKSPHIRKVLESFVTFGADESIMYNARPHVGTDMLRGIVTGIKMYLEAQGASFRFESTLTGFETAGGHVRSVTVNGTERLECDELVLAVGNAARDTFSMLYSSSVALEPKAIAVGVRIEHPQSVMNEYVYGRYAKEPLPAAEFSVTYRDPSGRGVYTFCNCPGGEVINASSSRGLVCINGMSLSARSGENSNSALVVTVRPEDYPGDHPLSGIEYQKAIERKCFEAAGGTYAVPGMEIGEFTGTGEGCVTASTMKPSWVRTDLNEVLPEEISGPLKNALTEYSKKIRGFGGGLILAPETRTSCPVRILRGKDMQSISVEGLYPAGEGAGYAGGIVSSACDGISCAEALIQKYI
ncbi:MAG: FAD-dependent monooxygenase [Eubacteriaceae bacterium]|nr:FAD-dependent monooxygenase [Eubacteriaceae bacterium]